MIKNCEICGTEFVCKRKTAKYCSDCCRVRAQRGVFSAKPRENADFRASLDENEQRSVIIRAHGVVDDLSRASMLTPAPICRSFGTIARKLADALEKEGM